MSAAGAVIVGGGLAGQRCAETLRARGYDEPIRIACGEPRPPYDRPPLSKGMLAGEVDEDALGFREASWYADNQVELILGSRALALDPAARLVALENGASLRFDKLLIATGSSPRRLPGLERFSNVHHLRTVADARALRGDLRPGARLAVIGAGFIGQEIAATAAAAGAGVTVVETLPLPLAGLLGERLGRWIVDLHAAAGVEMVLAARVSEARGNGRVEELVLDDGRRLDTDAVAVGIGVVPAAGWLAGSGLDPGGVRTDAAGRTAIPGVFAGGDVASAYDPRTRTHSRTEHWDAASRQGASVALAMLGAEPPPPPLPSFWSDQHGVRIQFVGDTAGADEIRLDGDPGARDFSAVFTAAGRPVAALAVNRPRELIALRRRIEEAQLRPDPERKENGG